MSATPYRDLENRRAIIDETKGGLQPSILRAPKLAHHFRSYDCPLMGLPSILALEVSPAPLETGPH